MSTVCLLLQGKERTVFVQKQGGEWLAQEAHLWQPEQEPIEQQIHERYGL